MIWGLATAQQLRDRCAGPERYLPIGWGRCDGLPGQMGNGVCVQRVACGGFCPVFLATALRTGPRSIDTQYVDRSGRVGGEALRRDPARLLCKAHGGLPGGNECGYLRITDRALPGG